MAATPISVTTIEDDLGGILSDRVVGYARPERIRVQFVQDVITPIDFMLDSGGTKPYTKPIPQTNLELAPMLYHSRR